jgi:hypothetical protein
MKIVKKSMHAALLQPGTSEAKHVRLLMGYEAYEVAKRAAEEEVRQEEERLAKEALRREAAEAARPRRAVEKAAMAAKESEHDVNIV